MKIGDVIRLRRLDGPHEGRTHLVTYIEPVINIDEVHVACTSSYGFDARQFDVVDEAPTCLWCAAQRTYYP